MHDLSFHLRSLYEQEAMLIGRRASGNRYHPTIWFDSNLEGKMAINEVFDPNPHETDRTLTVTSQIPHTEAVYEPFVPNRNLMSDHSRRRTKTRLSCHP